MKHKHVPGSMDFRSFFMLLFSLNFFLGHGQLPVRNYEPIMFHEPSAIWYNNLFDSNRISDLSDGYNIFSSIPTLTRPIIAEGFIYETYNLYQQPQGNLGFYLLKRNVESGEIIWVNKFYDESITLQEFPFFMLDGDEDNIFMYSFKKPDDYDELLPFFSNPIQKCKLIYRNIDKTSGVVREEIIPGDDADGFINILASYSRGLDYGDLIESSDTGFLWYWERNASIPPAPQTQKIVYQKINMHGQVIGEKDSIELGMYTSTINFLPWSEDTLVYFEFENGATRVSLKFYDRNFQKIGESEWSNLPFPLRSSSYFQLENEVVNIGTVYFEGGFKTIKRSVLCNRSGEVLDYIETEDDILTGDEYFSYVLPKRKQFIITKSKYELQPLRPITYLYKSNGAGQLGDYIHQWVSTDTMRHAWPRQISEIGNDQILVNFIESAIYREPGKTLYSHDYNARAQSLMLFEASDIGLGTVSTKEEKDDWTHLRLFPNPAADKIVVRANQNVTCQLKVRDFMGRIVISENMVDQEIEELAIQDLSPGIYFLAFEKEGNILECRKFVKI